MLGRADGARAGRHGCCLSPPQPGFHAGTDRAPLILVGAGTGLGPLAGFVRANGGRRPIHLFFGMRHPDSDFLYREELEAWAAEGRLSRLSTACLARQPARTTCRMRSRPSGRRSSADPRRRARDGLRRPGDGGRGRRGDGRMLAPTGMSPAMLKAEGRYVEDVY